MQAIGIRIFTDAKDCRVAFENALTPRPLILRVDHRRAILGAMRFVERGRGGSGYWGRDRRPRRRQYRRMARCGRWRVVVGLAMERFDVGEQTLRRSRLGTGVR